MRRVTSVLLVWAMGCGAAPTPSPAATATREEPVEQVDPEVQAAYLREARSWRLRYLYLDGPPTDALPSEVELAGFVESHHAELRAEYERQAARFAGLPFQMRTRHIHASVGGDAARLPEARARCESWLNRLRDGESFEVLARESDDEGSRERGGDLGWNPRGRMVESFEAAADSLSVGELSGCVETRFGFHVIELVGRREGDVPFEEATTELALPLFRAEQTRALVELALPRVAGGEPLDRIVAELGYPEEPLVPNAYFAELPVREGYSVDVEGFESLLERVCETSDPASFVTSLGPGWVAVHVVPLEADPTSPDAETTACLLERLRAAECAEAIPTLLPEDHTCGPCVPSASILTTAWEDVRLPGQTASRRMMRQLVEAIRASERSQRGRQP